MAWLMSQPLTSVLNIQMCGVIRSFNSGGGWLTAHFDSICFHTTPKAAQTDYLGSQIIFVDCTNQTESATGTWWWYGEANNQYGHWTELQMWFKLDLFKWNLDQPGLSFVTLMTPSNSNKFLLRQTIHELMIVPSCYIIYITKSKNWLYSHHEYSRMAECEPG